MKTFFDLTKPGIALFSIVAALLGYAASFPIGQPLDLSDLILLVVGVYLTSSGAFAVNQAQEYLLDRQMERTKFRPVATGKLHPFQGFSIGLLLVLAGLLSLYLLEPISCLIGAAIVAMYNGLYTLWWKRKSPFGVIPGAIPGALPITLGYAVNSTDLMSPQSVYLFLILFLWQMPHFWCLAIRYQDDYRKGGIPVMPVALGLDRTMYFLGTYTLAYIGVALVAPWFIESRLVFLFLVFPMSMLMLVEFRRYFFNHSGWLRFFLITNFSVIVFSAAPAIERWMQFVVLVHVGL